MAKKNKKQLPRASGALKKAVEGVTVQGARKISIKRADDNYDVVIIGAGFAGAIAARELSKAGMRTLILEARERPGGRTFNADFNGARLEMGGTWIHWGQPHIWAEMRRYGLDVKESIGATPEKSNWVVNDKLIEGTSERNFEILGNAYKKFVNVDGQMGRTIFPQPFSPLLNNNYKKFDSLSLTERMKEIDLSDEERDVLSSLTAMCCHGDPDKAGFLDMLKWNANAYYDVGVMWDMCARYKIKTGTESLIQAILEDGSADLKLSTPVSEVRQDINGVQVATALGSTYKAKTVVVTLPLNIIKDVSFFPALAPTKLASSTLGHTGKGTKFFVLIKQKVGRWSASAPYPRRIVAAWSDHENEQGTTIVCFGPQGLVDITDRNDVQSALREILPGAEVLDVTGHDWATDPYAKGTWCWYNSNQFTDSLAALQCAEGRLHFASADSANGWRGFIDGAIESGLRASQEIKAKYVVEDS